MVMGYIKSKYIGDGLGKSCADALQGIWLNPREGCKPSFGPFRTDMLSTGIAWNLSWLTHSEVNLLHMCLGLTVTGELRVQPEEFITLFSEPALNCSSNREKLTEVMFEEFRCGGMYSFMS